jgi:indolepyruvate ferredoxin oxidoreductase
MKGFKDWAEGLELIVVVEEKRKLIEVQVKEAIFDDRRGRRVYGYKDGQGDILFQQHYSLDPTEIALKLGRILTEEGRGTDRIAAGISRVEEARRANNAPELATRTPYFCSGCPHNTSTKVPEGAVAGAGIGCHFMAKWMDRSTEAYTHMGGEGANWIGEAPFSTRKHVFQNLGEGTYNHSGILAIRAAVAAKANITYKILFNDAVAMTGGQHNEGDLDPARIAHEVKAMGVENIALVYDPKEEIDWSAFPKGPRTLRARRPDEGAGTVPGARGRLRHHLHPDLRRRETPPPQARHLPRYRQARLHQHRCLRGLRRLRGAVELRLHRAGGDRAWPQARHRPVHLQQGFLLPQGVLPLLRDGRGRHAEEGGHGGGRPVGPAGARDPAIDGTHNIVITGVGGTGVVTIGANLAMAAHIEGKGAAMMEMAGLAQKGGAVHIHVRIAEKPEDISAIRVATGECNTLIGGDLVVSGGAKTLGLMTTGLSGAVVNSHEIVTGDFTRNTEFRIPGEDWHWRCRRGCRTGSACSTRRNCPASFWAIRSSPTRCSWARPGSAAHPAVARGDPAGGGAERRGGGAQQAGLRDGPLGHREPRGRRAPDRLRGRGKPKTLEEKIAFRAGHLTAYQGKRLARRYRKLVDSVSDPRLKEAVAKGYHKLLSLQGRIRGRAAAPGDRGQGAGGLRRRFQTEIPPRAADAARQGRRGSPEEARIRPLDRAPLPGLARLKALRGTPLDVFGYTAERRMERGLIRQYQADMAEFLPKAEPETMDALVALAELPLSIRGFGPVKELNARRAAKQREDLIAHLRAGGAPLAEAAE